MVFRTGHVPAARPPEWRVWPPQRVDDFSWLVVPPSWFDAADPLLDSILNFVYGAVVIVEVILLMPTVGVVRLAIHHFRSPGWYVECRYGNAATVRTSTPLPSRQSSRTARLPFSEFCQVFSQAAGWHRWLPRPGRARSGGW